jgi:hypothetical protein
MKKVVSVLTLSVILIISASSCKKASTPKSIASTESQWSFNGETDTANSTVYATEGSISFLEANDVISDSLTNFVLLEFGSIPVNNEKFPVLEATTTPDSAQCVLETGFLDATHTPTIVGQSAGSELDTVTVTIINGKIHASLSNITMQEYTSIFTGITGTLIQQ